MLLLVRGDDLRIANLTANSGLKLDVSSSGFLATPVLPASPGVDELSPVGNWRRPLRTYVDGRVASEATDEVSLIVTRIEDQTADLTQWQFEDGTKLYGIRADGDLATSLIHAATEVRTVKYVLKIFNIDDPSELWGYIPIYQEFSNGS